jgi:hypothetical protein
LPAVNGRRSPKAENRRPVAENPALAEILGTRLKGRHAWALRLALNAINGIAQRLLEFDPKFIEAVGTAPPALLRVHPKLTGS